MSSKKKRVKSVSLNSGYSFPIMCTENNSKIYLEFCTSNYKLFHSLFYNVLKS
jgi:hypothetical protein